MIITKILAAITVIFLMGGVCAAQALPDLETMKKKYPGDKAVILNDQEDVLIEVEGDSYKITESIIKETYLLQNTGTAFATDKVYSSHFYKIKEIDAKTLVPDGKKFIAKKVEKFVDSKSQPDYVFYDEIVTKSFVFPAIQPGVITSLKYVQELNNPLMLGAFFFKWRIPCEISRIVWSCRLLENMMVFPS